MLSQIYKDVVSEFKNIYGRFWATKQGNFEYYLKLDGYYFCKKLNQTIVIIRVRNKRTIEKISVKKAIGDKSLVKELHPADACIIGMLANNERNNVVDTSCDGWQKMKRFKQLCCFVKSNPILNISRKYFDRGGQEITVLRSSCLDKEIEIPTVELFKNEALLYALDTFQAVSIGYDASESEIRKMH
ncbi:MAG TPA: hypothetical protein VJK30_05470 [Coxiellaceae bacterium]|nr:MAG: hypothetical protein A3E81_01110 [Gammaproteobacteria bacterium RIFCSPHIGHO2_12_FULL_36_30]HLB56759.1 hypothetical protein [Coxiellaceae bacterium]